MLILTVTLILAFLGILLHVGRLPVQNLAAITLLIFGLAAVFEWSALRWNFPYRPLQMGGSSFWGLSIAWIGILLFTRRMSQWLFKSRRQHSNYGLHVFAATALLVVGIWAFLAFAVGPLSFRDLVGRLVVTVVILLTIFPWLIVKRPLQSGGDEPNTSINAL